MDVTTIPIPEDLRSIIEDMRDLIAKSETDHSKVDPTGWQHGGPDFITLVGNLEKEMNKQGFHVCGSTVRHFFKGANILNPYYPSKQLLIIPINGKSTLSRGGELPRDNYCYIEGQPQIYGDDIDVIIVAFDKGPGT